MIHLKSHDEIAIMTECGKKLQNAVAKLLPQIKEGMTTNEIDRIAADLIRKEGAELSFPTVKGYKWATCLCIGYQAVHTPPSERILKRGDVLTVDIGALYKGYHTDYATTIVIGNLPDEDIARFLHIGKRTLDEAIAKIKTGVYLGEIGKYIDDTIQKNGYKVMKQLTGHGIGKELHEDPYVLNYLSGDVRKTYRVQNGLTIAVEIIYSKSTEKIAYEPGVEWSIITSDRSLAACFEHTIAIIDGNTSILV